MPNRTITDARHFSNHRKLGNATSKSRRALRYFLALLAMGGLLLATSTFATAAPPPPKIEYGPFEGEIAPLGSDDWTTGNISGYKEGDLVRFRLTVSSLTGAQDGHIFIAFTSDPACPFFAFVHPTDVAVDFDTTTDSIEGGSGFTADFTAPLVQSGDNAVADFHVVSTSTPPSTVRLNFTLLLSDGAAGCATGSSQHVEVDSVSGDVKSTGKKTLPIPATAVAPVTDITVLKSAPASAAINTTISYTLTVNNLDQSTTAADVVVTDTLPAGVTYGSGSWSNPPGSGSCSAVGQIVTCELGDLAGGASATVTIEVTVDSDVALCGTTLTNSTSVSTTTLESETGNNSAQDSTDVDPCGPDLTIVKRIVNDNGGTKVVGDFGVLTDAGALVFGAGVEAPANTFTYTATTLTGLSAGSYTLVESNVGGYSEGSWGCTGGTGAVVGTFDAGSVVLNNGESVTCTITNNDVPAPLPGPCPLGTICAVNDLGAVDSRFFKFPGPTDCPSPDQPPFQGANFEGLESVGGILYAASGETSGAFASHPGGFYRVDFGNCVLTHIGDTGFDDVEALAVNPLDGTMWGFGEDEGLFTINLATGEGVLRRASSKKIEGLSWSLDGLRLYGVGDNKLWRLNCAAPVPPAPSNCSAGSWFLVTDTLPGDEFEGLETSRAPWPVVSGHDVLILANHGNATLFWWDVHTNAEIVSARLSTSGRSDVEGIVVCK